MREKQQQTSVKVRTETAAAAFKTAASLLLLILLLCSLQVCSFQDFGFSSTASVYSWAVLRLFWKPFCHLERPAQTLQQRLV